MCIHIAKSLCAPAPKLLGKIRLPIHQMAIVRGPASGGFLGTPTGLKLWSRVFQNCLSAFDTMVGVAVRMQSLSDLNTTEYLSMVIV